MKITVIVKVLLLTFMSTVVLHSKYCRVFTLWIDYIRATTSHCSAPWNLPTVPTLLWKHTTYLSSHDLLDDECRTLTDAIHPTEEIALFLNGLNHIPEITKNKTRERVLSLRSVVMGAC